MQELAHNTEVAIRDFFALNWDVICFPCILVTSMIGFALIASIH